MGCNVSSVFEPPRPREEVEDPMILDRRPTPIKAVNGDIMEVPLQDEAGFKPKTGEEGEAELPEGKFINGKLGITEDNEIEDMKRELLEGEEFEDLAFPADNSSIYFSGKSMSLVEWKRPREVADSPKVFVDGVSRRDVVQGSLGDCWFLSSCSAVAREKNLIERVIDPDQSLDGPNYSGMVVCRFWRFGEWVTVCIDDRLPTRNGELIFAHSVSRNEFWVALLEKAYAKLHGSYEAMEGGQSMDAMVDLTGGLAERYDLEDYGDKQTKSRIYRRLLKHCRNGSFITCSRKGDWRMAYRTDENGLVEGHAYTVSAVTMVKHNTLGNVKLIRVRNPWANEAEWRGVWADDDEVWKGVSEEHRRKLGLKNYSADGEFWMSFDDFLIQFEEVSVCTIGPDFNKDGKVDEFEKHKYIKGSWVKGVNAGGSRNDFESFATNPQYLLHVTDTDALGEDDVSDNGDDNKKASVLVGLLQEHRRSNRETSMKLLQVAVVIYKTDDPLKPLPQEHFMYNYDIASSGTYINYREVIARLEVEPGHYVIIPATFDPGDEADFIVRVFSEGNFTISKLQ